MNSNCTTVLQEPYSYETLSRRCRCRCRLIPLNWNGESSLCWQQELTLLPSLFASLPRKGIFWSFLMLNLLSLKRPKHSLLFNFNNRKWCPPNVMTIFFNFQLSTFTSSLLPSAPLQYSPIIIKILLKTSMLSRPIRGKSMRQGDCDD